MALTVDEFAERCFAMLGGGEGDVKLLDGIYRGRMDAMQLLAEQVADSPLRHMLTRDFQVNTVSGSADLNTSTIVGGGSLASANIYSILFDTIRRGKALHPDSTQPIQWFVGSTSDADCPRWLSLGYINGTLSSNSIYLRNDFGNAPTDQTMTYKASFCPTFDFFNVASADLAQLEKDIVSMSAKLISPPQPPQQGQ